MKKALLIALVVSTTLALASPASAWLDCGRVQAHHFGLSRAFYLALHWATLPHTNPHPGAVVVQRRNGRDSAGHPGGHVSRIISVVSPCRAVVADEKGRYTRDICSRLVAYVDPTGARTP